MLRVTESKAKQVFKDKAEPSLVLRTLLAVVFLLILFEKMSERLFLTILGVLLPDSLTLKFDVQIF